MRAPKPLALAGSIAVVWVGVAFGASGFDPRLSTIFVGRDAQELKIQCSRIRLGPITDVWSPSEEQIIELESALFPLLSERLGAMGPNALHADDYFRQYAGFVVGGRPIIYVNGIHRSYIESTIRAQKEVLFHIAGSDWQHEPIVVCDGGAAFFGVEYDVDSRTFRNLAFNGN